jgi:hypothetical protein
MGCRRLRWPHDSYFLFSCTPRNNNPGNHRNMTFLNIVKNEYEYDSGGGASQGNIIDDD